jgi:acylphosphatase
MVTANWTSLDSPTGWNAQTNHAVGKNANGFLEIFTVASNNALWHRKQTTLGVDWGNWASLGQPLPGLNGYTAVAANKDGRLEVFCTGIDGALWHVWQVAPNGTWSTWASLGNPTGVDLVLDINVHENSDGRLEVFMAGSNNALWHIWQVAPNGTWSNWASLGNPPTANVQSAPSVRKNKDGRLEAFNICSDGALWHIWQITPGGVWGSWNSLGMPSDSVILSTGPLVIENTDGRLEAFVGGSNNALWHTWQVSPGDNWSS